MLGFLVMAGEWRYALPILNAIAVAILVAFGLFLIGVSVVVFARPAVAERFFMSFIIHSVAMWQPNVFWFVGWAIALSSLVLILTPWQWHHHFGEKVRPMLIRRMKVYAVGLLAFGVLIIYAVFTGVSPTAA